MTRRGPRRQGKVPGGTGASAGASLPLCPVELQGASGCSESEPRTQLVIESSGRSTTPPLTAGSLGVLPGALCSSLEEVWKTNGQLLPSGSLGVGRFKWEHHIPVV